MQREGDLRWEIRFRKVVDKHYDAVLKKEIKTARAVKVRQALKETISINWSSLVVMYTTSIKSIVIWALLKTQMSQPELKWTNAMQRKKTTWSIISANRQTVSPSITFSISQEHTVQKTWLKNKNLAFWSKWLISSQKLWTHSWKRRECLLSLDCFTTVYESPDLSFGSQSELLRADQESFWPRQQKLKQLRE